MTAPAKCSCLCVPSFFPCDAWSDARNKKKKSNMDIQDGQDNQGIRSWNLLLSFPIPQILSILVNSFFSSREDSSCSLPFVISGVDFFSF